MELWGTEFGSVFNASGARNFMGQGYWFHGWLRPFGLSWKGSTFVAKTTTLMPREGNMPLKADGMTPKELMPGCIVTDRSKQIALNAVGLSGPGAEALIEYGGWQARTEPFVISFMTVDPSEEAWVEEAARFVTLLSMARASFRAPFVLEVNFSCPNTGHDQRKIVNGAVRVLQELWTLNVPLIAKLNVLVSHAAAQEISTACNALCITNTIPWGQLPERIPWSALFGSETSPLKDFGGGGLSGAPLLDLGCEWIAHARDIGITKPIIACGGILSTDGVRRYEEAGASAIQLGSVAFLAPTRVANIIRFGNHPDRKWRP